MTEREEYLLNCLDEGLSILTEAMGQEMDDYDTDQADTECYLDCFKQSAEIMKSLKVSYCDEEGEFLVGKREPGFYRTTNKAGKDEVCEYTKHGWKVSWCSWYLDDEDFNFIAVSKKPDIKPTADADLRPSNLGEK